MYIVVVVGRDFDQLYRHMFVAHVDISEFLSI